MYTQVCGVLNVGSIDCHERTKEINAAVDKACEVLIESDYWSAGSVREKIHVHPGGNGSVFIAIACEGKIIGYGDSWEKVIRAICLLLPTAEGRIEWVYETDESENNVWIISGGIIREKAQNAYRNGYGNG